MRQSLTKIDALRLSSGASCVVSGLITALPSIVDVPELLRDMTIANAGSVLGIPSLLFAKFTYPVTAVIGIVLVTTGLAFLSNRLVRHAANVQTAFFALFMVFVFKLMPGATLACVPLLGIALLLAFDRRDKPRDSQALNGSSETH